MQRCHGAVKDGAIVKQRRGSNCPVDSFAVSHLCNYFQHLAWKSHKLQRDQGN